MWVLRQFNSLCSVWVLTLQLLSTVHQWGTCHAPNHGADVTWENNISCTKTASANLKLGHQLSDNKPLEINCGFIYGWNLWWNMVRSASVVEQCPAIQQPIEALCLKPYTEEFCREIVFGPCSAFPLRTSPASGSAKQHLPFSTGAHQFSVASAVGMYAGWKLSCPLHEYGRLQGKKTFTGEKRECSATRRLKRDVSAMRLNLD